MRLVLIETSGNQAYIFATNKLRENVGASELTYRSGTQWVLEAIQQLGGPALYNSSAPVPAQHIRDQLRNTNVNRPIQAGGKFEVIVAASGKALVLADDDSQARRLVSLVTRRALKEAPGMEIWGVVSREFDLASVSIHDVIKEVHREYELVRSRLPGPQTRFQRLPIIMDCGTSGLPAAKWDNSGRDPGPRSAMSLAKIAVAQDALQRIRRLATDKNLPRSTEKLEDLGCEWFAVIHADGNGLGQIFLNFDECVRSPQQKPSSAWNRTYIEQLRDFSLALDECTEHAFLEALAGLKPLKSKEGALPIVPLVLGGDDLTVVCDGQQALQFTVKFLQTFEETARGHAAIQRVLGSALGRRVLPQGLTSCAGVAIIKPHFPFFAAYELAEALLKSAKKHKPLSAIDFHILYDASNPDLERVREEWTLDDGSTLLTARPYVVTRNSQVDPRRHWSKLKERIEAVRARDPEEDRRRLPNSMLHELREGLFLGRQQADFRLKLVLPRYRNQGLDKLLGDGNSLFWSETDNAKAIHRTALLDALDAAEFWG
ncbi:hypothetical protein HRbin36_02023 [bacterium HR36]|nr:hypothetical protein HRbin36_02023 [bacterium HR36]